MRLIVFVFIFLFQNVYSQFNSTKFQIYGGLSKANIEKKILFINNGIHYCSKNSNLVFGIENNLYYSNKPYTWEGIGNYNYQRTIDILNFSVGFNICKTKRLNPYFGLSLNNSFYQGKLKTENELIKKYILNNYDKRNNNLFFLFKLNLKVTNHYSIYTSLNLINLKKKENFALPSFGLSYNFNYTKNNE